MAKEFEFFITEKLPQVIEWSKEKKQQGSIAVGNATQLLTHLSQHTEPNDELSCRISGAWLDECIKWSVRALLTPSTLAEVLPQRSVSQVIVDLTTSVAFSERLTELTLEERRRILMSKLWPLASDPRLTILPEPSQQER